MLHVTQLIYLHPGAEATFDAFESVALPLLAKYRGELVLRLRPPADARIGGSAEAPYELHVVRFDSAADLEAFSNDPERQRVLHLKDRSVARTVVFRSNDG